MNIKEKFYNLFGLYLEKHPSREQVLKSLNNLLPYETEYKLIRLGEDGDGGYLIPDDLSGIEYCYSCGVGHVTQFEKQLYEKYSIKSKMIDPNELPNEIFPHESVYYKKFLDFTESGQSMHINDFIQNDSKEDAILKLDIEGDEYQNLISLENNKFEKIRILIIEFHNLRDLRSKFFMKIFNKIFQKLNKYFVVCHLHPNNTSGIKYVRNIPIPDMVEVTLINKKRLNSFSKKYAQIPNPLDKRTSKNNKEIYIDKKWYS